MATPEQTRQQIIDLVGEFDANVRATREDLTLSPLGRYQRLQSLYELARDRVAQLRSTLDQSTSGGRREPRGADGTDVFNFRDAQERIAKVKQADELGEVMESASSSGDDMLLRAAFARAWRESTNPFGNDAWAGLVAEYAAQNPGVVRDLDALRSLTTVRGATRSFLERMGMTVAKPQELNRPEETYSDQKPGQPERPATLVRGV
jgi:hypothetical protein